MYRNYTCGQLNISNAGEEVVLSGWVAKNRDLGGLTFIDLRDRYGITQIAFNMDIDRELCTQARTLDREFVIKIIGKCIERESKNLKLPTGEIEVIANKIEVLSTSETPPFTIEDESDGGDELRMKYRYLDIRRPILRDRLITRAKVSKIVREYLDSNDFIEIETPFFIKSTPEGARDFLVPSRMNKGSFYALPQSPQILKQLLMVGGMDRYYQIVKCFRDEDFRGDRQPEFTQIDCEMSFVTQEDVLEMFEGLTKKVYKEIKGIVLDKFIRLSYSDAMKFYGSDKPDLRFDCKIVDLNDNIPTNEFVLFNDTIANGGTIAAINAKGLATYSRKQIDALVDMVKQSNIGIGGLIWIKLTQDGYKSSVDKFFDSNALGIMTAPLNMEVGDMALIASDRDSKVRKALGELRLHLAQVNDWIDKNATSVLWIVDFPLFDKDEDTGEIIFMHHPFCNPKPEDLKYLDTNPEKVRGELYDLVINGNEIVSGSIRIHNNELQNKIFEILGLSEQEMQDKFGFFVEALKYGTPPHGGCAFGLDRWIMLLSGGQTIRDVIAFPKNNNGRDTMMDAPSVVNKDQLKVLGINIED